MYKSLLKMGSLASLSSTVKAGAFPADDVTNNANGLGGAAPCMDSYIGIWASEDGSGLGADAHAVHGIELNDKSIVAVGTSQEKEGESVYDGFIVKTHDYTTCGSTYETAGYMAIEGAGTDCATYDWVTRINNVDGLTQKMNWVTESPDNTYLMVVGFAEQSDSTFDISVSKVAVSDGSVTWTMIYSGATASTSAGAETGGFTSSGAFVLGGFVNSPAPASDMIFKSAGIVTEATPFIA
jgi:hypothetical protein